MAFGITTAAATSPAIASARSQRLSNGDRGRSLADLELASLVSVKMLNEPYRSSNCANLRVASAVNNKDETREAQEE
jgi:hypothetical protein